MDMLLQLIENLGINSTIFVIIGIFVVSYWVCYVVFLKKLTAFLVERDNRTQGRSENVDQFNEELKNLSIELADKKAHVNKDADALFAEIKNKALAEQADVMKAAKTRAASDVAEARASVEKNLKAETEKVRAQIPELAASIVERLMAPQKKTNKSAEDSVRTGV